MSISRAGTIRPKPWPRKLRQIPFLRSSTQAAALSVRSSRGRLIVAAMEVILMLRTPMWRPDCQPDRHPRAAAFISVGTQRSSTKIEHKEADQMADHMLARKLVRAGAI